MNVATRPIATQPTNPAYDAGWVFAFRKCPECKWEVTVTNETQTSFDFECPACSVKGSVDMGGING